MQRLVLFSLLWFAVAQGIPIAAAAQASSEVTARGSFSETELIKGLAGGMGNKRLVTLVGEYGVDFSLTPEVEDRLRAVGADDELVEAIRKGKAKPLSEADLLKRLAGGMENRRLAAQVGQYGVEFSLTPEIEERLRAAGAGDQLAEAIRKAKSTPKTPAQAEARVNPKDGGSTQRERTSGEPILQRSASDVVKAIYASCSDGRYAEAEKLLSVSALDAARNAGGMKLICDLNTKPGAVTYIEIVSDEVMGERATVVARIHFRNGSTKENDRTTLIREQGAWKISFE